jgi:heme ABC exporter ATP-binding subunit CcmA
VNAVEAEGLEKRFGRVRALRGLDLALAPGTRALVLGRNGAGKSTLLRVLAGLCRPSAGRVRIAGVDPFRPGGTAARARVGYLGAEPGLYGELTVEENLLFCARLHGLAAERAGRAIAAMGLEPMRERRARTLSQGFRRRAGLARAALAEPDLLLLDEPWNGLDGEARERLAALLDGVRARGATVLVAAPSLDGGAGAFDRVLELRDGGLAAGGGERA